MDIIRIGRRIARFRERRGLSTLELARMAQKSQATISRIENGKQAANVRNLAQLAQALRVHPFALLSDDPLWHSVLLPAPGTLRLDGPTRALAWFIGEARRRSKLALPEAARRLAMSEGEMESIEFGFSLPTAEALHSLAGLYDQPVGEWLSLRRLEEEQPALSAKLATLFQVAACASSVAASDLKGVETDELRRLRRYLAHSLAGGPEATDRRGGYYKLGHLSDALLARLQDGDFHALAENLAESGATERLTRCFQNDRFRAAVERLAELVEPHLAENDGAADPVIHRTVEQLAEAFAPATVAAAPFPLVAMPEPLARQAPPEPLAQPFPPAPEPAVE